MEENKIIISTEIFAKLVEAKTKLQIIERMLAEKKYISDDTLKCILNTEGGNENG